MTSVPRLVGKTVCPVSRNQTSVSQGLLVPNCRQELLQPGGRGQGLQVRGDLVQETLQRALDRGGRGASGLSRRSSRVGNRRGRGKRRDLRGRRRRPGIAVHGAGVLGPHFCVLGFQLRDHPVVQPKDVGLQRLSQGGTVGRDQRRGHHRGKRGLKGRRGRLGLCGGLLGLAGCRSHPGHIRLDRRGHRRRGRPQPFLAGQLGDDCVVALCRRR